MNDVTETLENLVPEMTEESSDSNMLSMTASELAAQFSIKNLMGLSNDLRLAERWLIGAKIEVLRSGKNPVAKSDNAAMAAIVVSACVAQGPQAKPELRAAMDLIGLDVQKPSKAFGTHNFIRDLLKVSKQTYEVRPNGLEPDDTLSRVNRDIAARKEKKAPVSAGARVIAQIVALAERLESEAFACEGGFGGDGEPEALKSAMVLLNHAVEGWKPDSPRSNFARELAQVLAKADRLKEAVRR